MSTRGMRGRAKDGIEKQSNDKGLGEGEEPTRICTGTNPRGPVLLVPVLGAREPRRENEESFSRAKGCKRKRHEVAWRINERKRSGTR